MKFNSDIAPAASPAHDVPAVNASHTNDSTGAVAPKLGELLYADPAITRVAEKDWLALVRSIAAGDEAALRALYEKAYPVVFAYLMQLTRDRERTEALILDVFQDVWCEAPVFDGSSGPVLGWIMRQARASALADTTEPTRRDPHRVAPSLPAENTPTDPGPEKSESQRLLAALNELTLHEREVLEATLLEGLTYAEAAERWQESAGTIKSRVRSGLSKLSQALQAGGDGS